MSIKLKRTSNKCGHGVPDILPSSSLRGADGLLTRSPLGGLGSGTGGCSAVTHVGSALFMSSLLTELSSCRGDSREEDEKAFHV